MRERRGALTVATLAAACGLGPTACNRAKQSSGTEDLVLHARSKDTTRCRAERAALPVVPLDAGWENDRPTPSLRLDAGAAVWQEGKVVARVLGSCLTDPAGGVLVSVDGEGRVTGPGGEPLGAFEHRPTFDEVYVEAGRGALAVGSNGNVYLQREDGETIPVPASLTGDVAHARRTALLLLSLIGQL